MFMPVPCRHVCRCVAVRAGRPELLDAVNRALKALLYSGELHNRSRSYFQYIIY